MKKKLLKLIAYYFFPLLVLVCLLLIYLSYSKIEKNRELQKDLELKNSKVQYLIKTNQSIRHQFNLAIKNKNQEIKKISQSKKEIYYKLNQALKRKHKEIKRLTGHVYTHVLPDLEIKNYPSVDYTKIFNRQQLEIKHITTLNQLAQAANQLYSKYQPQLTKAWGLPNSKKLRAIFYMNLLAYYWTGNHPLNLKGSGFVLQFPKDSERSMKAYMGAKSAECTDYAFFLYMLLTSAHIKTQLVEIGPHIFDQVDIDNQWYTLDADSNLMFKGTWYSIVNRPQNAKVTVTIFPSPKNIYYSSNKSLYRSDFQLPLRMIMRALTRFNRNYTPNEITLYVLRNIWKIYFPNKPQPEPIRFVY